MYITFNDLTYNFVHSWNIFDLTLLAAEQSAGSTFLTRFTCNELKHVVSLLLLFDTRIRSTTPLWYSLSACLKACPHCRRKVRLSPNLASVAVFCDTALFCDSVDRA